MKRKLLIILFSVFVFTCLFATSVFAAVNYDETATLADGTVLPIYDEDNNPLIWYVSGTDASGNNVYSSVPNNRNEPNATNDSYVTYVSSTGTWAQLNDIYIHTYDAQAGEYVSTIDDELQIVVLNLREFDMIYLGGINADHIQYMYYPSTLKDCPEKFKGKTAIRLVDMSVCENLVGGFGGTQNFSGCTNLHTVRLPIGPSYTFEGKNNWKFKNTAISSIVIPEAVTSIGVDNFYGCKNLESIYLLGNTTSLGQRNFEGCTNLANIYFLGDNPTIDLISFKENFVECVNDGKTLDFKSIGKYFFFVTTNVEYLNGVMDVIGASAIISYDDYIESPGKYVEGRYIISGTNICDVYYGDHETNENNSNKCVGICCVCGATIVNHAQEAELNVNIVYGSYTEQATKTTACSSEGCTYCVTEKAEPLFVNLGFSASEYDGAQISVNYRVNEKAISEYERITGEKVNYGVFAVTKKNIGKNDIFDAEGNALSGVIAADITGAGFNLFSLKITGFTEAQKELPFAMGAFVGTEKDGATEYSYLQIAAPAEGEKYYFATYNEVVALTPSDDEESAQ